MTHHLSNEDWKQKLTPAQYAVLREKSTEPAFTGKYVNTKNDGTYVCAGCGSKLFNSDTKFDSNCGWPSFYDALPGAVEFKLDNTLGIERTEVVCASCGGHLGHIFKDAPDQPSGNRFCINSIALNLKLKDKE